MFRAPTTTAEEFAVFYQDDYSEGFTTDLPSQADLDLLKQGHFKDSGKDYGKYIGVLQALGCRPGQLLLDYGCSWGYGGWQFAEAGFRVIGFEVSEGRCRYAQDMLGVNAASTIDRLPMQGEFDVFFSSHVLEHIPNLGEVLLLARTIVKPGGLFVAFTPNGSHACRVKAPSSWSRTWGFVHPLFLDADFYAAAFAGEPYIIDSSPFALPAIAAWARGGDGHGNSVALQVGGDELMVAVRLAGPAIPGASCG